VEVDVEQDTTTDDSSFCEVLDPQPMAELGWVCGQPTPEAELSSTDVPEPVPLGGCLRIEVVELVVPNVPVRLDERVRQRCAAVQRRIERRRLEG